MIFHENHLLADDSHEISYLIFFKNWERCRKLQSLRVNNLLAINHVNSLHAG